MNIFLDESVLKDLEFYRLIESQSLDFKHSTLCLDDRLIQLSKNPNWNSLSESELVLIANIQLVLSQFHVEVEVTQEYTNQEQLESWFEQLPHNESIFITNSRTVVNFVYDFVIKHRIPIKYVKNALLLDWNLEKVLKEAFYLEKDTYFKDLVQQDYDYVFSPQYGYLSVEGKPIYSGGEGEVFRTYKNLMIKIYYSKHINYQNYLKLNAMVDDPVSHPQIIWPLDLVYNDDHQFVGYVMKEVNNAQSMDDLRDVGFSPYKPLERIDIGIQLLKNVRYLHQRNILIGDMKFDNILVKNPHEVYLIDTGSFQVKDYPCTVFNLEFTDTSISESNLKKNLRDPDSEYFPINKILFELLILKSPFYSSQNIEIDAANNREFHYTLEPPKFSSDPPRHLKAWFSLSLTLRQYFYYYFKEKKITYLDELIEALEEFKKSITPKGVN